MLCLLVISLAVVALSSPIADLNDDWATWKAIHNKVYEDGEEQVRRLIWEDNLNIITKHNLEYDMKKHSYRLGMNKYADMKNTEFIALFNSGLKQSNRTLASTFMAPTFAKIPDELDWRKQGYVTPVRNQGYCLSDWGFSAVGALEGQYFKKTGKLTELSVQNLVDCSIGNSGCSGGLVELAFDYVKKNCGINSEKCYPYKASAGECLFKPECIAATCTGYTKIKPGSEEDLKQAVATVGPISVEIDASNFSLQFYESGVYDEPSCRDDHPSGAMLVVGYGTNKGKDFWLLKNSWGTGWGLEGYIMMSRNKNNQCGIASLASYPLV